MADSIILLYGFVGFLYFPHILHLSYFLFWDRLF